MKVELSAEAHSQAVEIDVWWRTHRLAAPDLFTTELANALTMLEGAGVGAPYGDRTKGVRRLLLRETHYHLYFVERVDRIFVVAVWSAFRGQAPKL